jgi:hypothetical protein
MPILVAFVTLDLLLPGALLFWLYRSRSLSRIYLASIGALALVVVLVLAFSILGAWYLFGTFWIWGFAIALAGGFVHRVRRGLPGAWMPPSWSRELVLTGLNIGLLAAGSALLAFLARADAYDAQPLRLSAPLRGARFYVMGGGANWSVNHHSLFSELPEQRYALDILQVNALGWRAPTLWPRELDLMYVFGADIVAPCNGDVVAIRDGLPNRELMDPDVSNRYGNHVIVLCEGRSVVLAHMQRGTVGVRVGEPVKTGQKVGEVGNSGSTIEPHLHIHAVEGRSEDGSGVAVPVLIDGRFLIKGATFGG